MKATELRIGNLIGMSLDRWPQNIFKVLEVAEDAMKTSACGMRFDSLDDIDYHDAIHFEGIPLTEEFLLKVDWNGYKYLHINSNFSIDTDGHLYYHGDYTGVNASYVHQLQNLYFALTGQELI